jgi:hypothetical protein
MEQLLSIKKRTAAAEAAAAALPVVKPPDNPRLSVGSIELPPIRGTFTKGLNYPSPEAQERGTGYIDL